MRERWQEVSAEELQLVPRSKPGVSNLDYLLAEVCGRSKGEPDAHGDAKKVLVLPLLK
jgi:hypothetical protein